MKNCSNFLLTKVLVKKEGKICFMLNDRRNNFNVKASNFPLINISILNLKPTLIEKIKSAKKLRLTNSSWHQCPF